MKLRKVLAGAMAFVMVASSLVVNPLTAKAAETTDSKLYESITISETEKTLVLEEGANTHTLTAEAGAQYLNGGAINWCWGDTYTLVGDFDITMEFYLDAFIRGTANWDSFIMELQGATDTMGITLRADAYGWNFGEGTNVPTYVPTYSWAWEDYQTVTDNQNVTLNVKKTSDTTVELALSFKESGATETYVITYPNGVPAEVGFHICGEGGDVTVYKYVNNNSTTVLPERDTTIEWSSSDTSVATVDADGKVTAVAVGTATITAKAGTASATCEITVADAINAITAIDVTADKTEIKIGNTAQLSVEYTAEKADKDITDDKTVTYTSSNEEVATVDATGKVTAVAVGTATITASVVNGTITDTVEITVPAVPVTDIELTVDKTDLEKGDIVNVVATVNPEDTTDDTTITWTSSNEKVATVDANGTVTAVGGGNATITASIGDVTAEVDFKVTAYETVTTTTKLDDMEIGDFLSVVSKGVQLKKGHTYVITFDTASPNATSNWETPCYAVYTSDEGAYNVGNWAELFLCRADVFGWPGGVFDNNTLSETFPTDYTWSTTYPADWAAWLAECVAGTTGTITAKWDGSTVTVTYEIAGAKTVTSMPCTDSNVYLSLTGQNTNITDIEVADTYVKKVTGTGDVSMVVPMVLVLFGGAVVVVASKKKFA